MLFFLQANPPAGAEPSLWDIIIPFLVVMAIMWLLVIWPQRREQKRRDAMLKELKKGDMVITSSGIVGKVVRIKPQQVEIESVNTKLAVLRSSILSVVEEKESEGEAKKEKDKE